MSTPGSQRLRPFLLGAAAVVLILVVVGVLCLDRVLLSTARQQAARLSGELHRPIAVEGVATRLWGGLGVKVTGLSVGPGPGEGRPLVEVQRAEVSVAVLRALLSGGKEISVREAVVQGVRLNV
jgi:AsmA protein